VTDQVEVRPVGPDDELGLGRPRLLEAEAGGGRGDRAPLVDRDVGAVNGRSQEGVGADAGVRTGRSTDLGEPRRQVELAVVGPLRQEQLEGALGEGGVDLTCCTRTRW
jgi:hypothetical protein